MHPMKKIIISQKLDISGGRLLWSSHRVRSLSEKLLTCERKHKMSKCTHIHPEKNSTQTKETPENTKPKRGMVVTSKFCPSKSSTELLQRLACLLVNNDWVLRIVFVFQKTLVIMKT